MAKEYISVRVPQEMKRDIERMAGEERRTLSQMAYILLERGFVGSEPRRAGVEKSREHARPLTTSSAEMPTDPKPKKSKKTCPHGVEQGYNCWQCGGLAKVERGEKGIPE